MKKLLLFFVDGLGLGEDSPNNPARNFLSELTGVPFTASSVPAVFTEGILAAADATGGVDGRPQSATGQTSMMCGINAPAALGYHLTALPNEELVSIVRENNMMKALAAEGLRVTASNLYTDEFLARRAEMARKRGRNSLPVSTLTIQSSGVPFRKEQEYREGRAVFTDLTNHTLVERGYDIPLISPEEAASRMIRILEEADFVFHEFFATDTYAHKGRPEDLRRALNTLDVFLKTLRSRTNAQETAVLLVSDHGNCEDALSADHNRNPVPILLLSRNEEARSLFRQVNALEKVKGAVMQYFSSELNRSRP